MVPSIGALEEPERGLSLLHYCSAGFGQSAGGAVTLQKFPGLSNSSATFHFVASVPTGSEWTTRAVVVRLLRRISMRILVSCFRGRKAWSTKPWPLTSTARTCPRNVGGESKL